MHGGQLFWARPFQERTAGLGCVGRGATCLDSGMFDYESPRADGDSVYFIRDHDIVGVSY